jgi:hypothetical protein
MAKRGTHVCSRAQCSTRESLPALRARCCADLSVVGVIGLNGGEHVGDNLAQAPVAAQQHLAVPANMHTGSQMKHAFQKGLVWRCGGTGMEALRQRQLAQHRKSDDFTVVALQQFRAKQEWQSMLNCTPDLHWHALATHARQNYRWMNNQIKNK